MQNIEKNIQIFIKDLNLDLVSNMFSHIRTGKFLRSKLILSISKNVQDCKKIENQIYKLCAIVELIHLASLLHDDVIDEAKLRRGAKSIHSEFGAKNAIMLGDILYSKAFYELSHFDKEIANSLSNAVVLLSKGELLDVKESEKFNYDEEKYLKIIYYKTAALIESAAFCAAQICGLKAKAFGEYGKNLGIAFQIIDDILDIISDEKTLGKPVMSDFKEGKTTLPYIYLYKNLQDDEKTKLLSFFKKNLQNDDLLWLKEKLNFGVELSKQKVQIYAQNALESIKCYDNNELKLIISQMIERSF